MGGQRGRSGQSVVCFSGRWVVSVVAVVSLLSVSVVGGWSAWSQWSVCCLFQWSLGGQRGRSGQSVVCFSGRWVVSVVAVVSLLSVSVVSLLSVSVVGGWSAWSQWSVCCLFQLSVGGQRGRSGQSVVCFSGRWVVSVVAVVSLLSVSVVSLLPVSVVGGWSAWSQWSVCCLFQWSVGGQRGCSGQSVVCFSCRWVVSVVAVVSLLSVSVVSLLPVSVVGGWSAWSQWSVCCLFQWSVGGQRGRSGQSVVCFSGQSVVCFSGRWVVSVVAVVSLLSVSVVGGWSAWSSGQSVVCFSGQSVACFSGRWVVSVVAVVSLLPVSVVGGWSAWSQWSVCCLFQWSVGGQRGRSGQSVVCFSGQSVVCFSGRWVVSVVAVVSLLSVSVVGGWSAWSQWSVCCLFQWSVCCLFQWSVGGQRGRSGQSAYTRVLGGRATSASVAVGHVTRRSLVMAATGASASAWRSRTARVSGHMMRHMTATHDAVVERRFVVVECRYVHKRGVVIRAQTNSRGTGNC